MKLVISKSKNSTSLYVAKSIYVNGKHTSKIVEKLGTVAELEKQLDGQDPIQWAREYIKELTRQEKEDAREIIVRHSSCKPISKGQQRSFHGGYLFLQQLYHELGLPSICAAIMDTHKFTFDLNAVLSRLLYARILFPSSKLATWQLTKQFLEPVTFELQHMYRALEVLAKETDFIQAQLYKNSCKHSRRNTGVLYYDCTNYFFEIEQEEGLKQYGPSKEHRPSPIVQMGLFMDGDGIPLAFRLHKGNTNEQVTLKPLEQTILSDFALSRFVVCTDAGLASKENRLFNTKGARAFITTQSVKKLKKHLKQWALQEDGWHLPGVDGSFNIKQLQGEENTYRDKMFYKQRWITEDGLSQRLIVTYCLKYRDYQQSIRDSQVQRALHLINSNPSKLNKSHQNDYKRFIQSESYTMDGEIAQKQRFHIDTNLIDQEQQFDGFYAVCTNLVDDPASIIQINQRRWLIEDCFRIMKSEFKARPVYLKRDDRITAHFLTCFLSLILFRFLERKLDLFLKHKPGGSHCYTCHQILQQLRNMNFLEVKGEGYIPTYTRTDFTDDLHEAFGFRTDLQIVTKQQMNKIFSATKS